MSEKSAEPMEIAEDEYEIISISNFIQEYEEFACRGQPYPSRPSKIVLMINKFKNIFHALYHRVTKKDCHKAMNSGTAQKDDKMVKDDDRETTSGQAEKDNQNKKDDSNPISFSEIARGNTTKLIRHFEMKNIWSSEFFKSNLAESDLSKSFWLRFTRTNHDK